jgi:nitrate/TMAO reductase-like tetraheme cytochrome c subunit
MNVRCSYCRHSFNLSRDYMAQAIAEAAEKHQKYHTVECINCRKHIKVPIKQMKHFVPEPIKDDSAS